MILALTLSILVGFIWSATNIIDKYVISKHLSDPGLIYILISIIHIVFGAGIMFFVKESVGIGHLILLAATAAIWIVMGYAYFIAARIEEISRVAPLFALVPVFVTIFGALFLGEVFTIKTYAGITIVVIGSALIMFRGHVKALLSSRAFGLMVLSAFAASIQSIVTKYMLNFYSYWTVYAWFTLLAGAIGIMIFARLMPKLRQSIKESGWKGVILYSLSESNSQIAVFLYTIAASLWYISLVSSVVTVQYLFVFIWTILLTRLKPEWIKEELTKKITIQKIFAIVLIIGGIYLIT